MGLFYTFIAIIIVFSLYIIIDRFWPHKIPWDVLGKRFIVIVYATKESDPSLPQIFRVISHTGMYDAERKVRELIKETHPNPHAVVAVAYDGSYIVGAAGPWIR